MPDATARHETPELPAVLSVAELGRMFGLGRSAAYELAGRIGIRVGRRLLVPRARVERLLAEGYPRPLLVRRGDTLTSVLDGGSR